MNRCEFIVLSIPGRKIKNQSNLVPASQTLA
jgi:hypothetical protein